MVFPDSLVFVCLVYELFLHFPNRFVTSKLNAVAISLCEAKQGNRYKWNLVNKINVLSQFENVLCC